MGGLFGYSRIYRIAFDVGFEKLKKESGWVRWEYRMHSYLKYIKHVKQLGARGAKVIPARRIVAAE